MKEKYWKLLGCYLKHKKRNQQILLIKIVFVFRIDNIRIEDNFKLKMDVLKYLNH